MTPLWQRRWLWTLSVLLTVVSVCAVYWFVRWGILRVQVALGEEQTKMFEECRTDALQSSDPERIVGVMEAAIIYYPSGTKQTVGSHVDRMVERSREWAIQDIIGRLQEATGTDLGNDPQTWIDRYGEKRGSNQSVEATQPRTGDEDDH